MTLTSSLRPNTTNWQAIIFDLDDTLYPERDYVLSGFMAVAQWAEANLGIPCDAGFASLRSLYLQGVHGNTFNQWLTIYGQSETCLSKLIQVYREHNPVIALSPATALLLKRLHARYLLGLLSDGYLTVQQRKIAALGLATYFDVIVLSDEWGRDAWKPSSKPFNALLLRLGGLHGSSAVYIADNPAKDFLGARAAGLASIRLRLPDGEYGAVEPPTSAHAPDLTLWSYDELSALLLSSRFFGES